MDEIFNARLRKLTEGSNFIMLYLMNVLWNFRSKKFIALAIAIIFFAIGKLDQTQFVLALGIYAGSNILDKGANIFAKNREGVEL